jgi:hypothetical protein
MKGTYVILYHKQSTSARTRFLRLGHGGICGPEALPSDASLDDQHGDERAAAATRLTMHPGMLLRGVERELQLPRGSLESDIGFRCQVFVAGAASDVYLAHFTSIDPPFEAAEAAGAAFIDLTQARGLASAELLLLRQAYEHVLG